MSGLSQYLQRVRVGCGRPTYGSLVHFAMTMRRAKPRFGLHELLLRLGFESNELIRSVNVLLLRLLCVVGAGYLQGAAIAGIAESDH